MKYKTKVYNSLNRDLIKKWEFLWKRSDYSNVFNSYGWFLSHKEKNSKFKIFACYEGIKLVGVCPLIEGKVFGIKCLVSPGKAFVGDIPFLVKSYEKELLSSIFEKVINEGTFSITNIEESVAKKLNEIFPKAHFPLISVIPYLDLSSNYKTKISKSNDREINKVLKRLDKDLTLNVKQGKALDKSFELLINLEQHSSKKSKHMDMFSKEENIKLYKNFVRNLRKNILIAFLEYKKTPIAYQFGFLVKNHFSAYQTAFLEKHIEFSPGRVMLYKLFEYFSGKKIKTFDLGGGISFYKVSFTNEYFLMYDMNFSPNPIVSFLWKSINFARRTKQIIFPKKYTRDHEFLFKTLK